MLHSKLTKIALGVIAFSAINVEASDLQINGFMSVAGGATLSQGTDRNHITGVETDAVFVADDVTNGFYDDALSFKADTNYGIQITSNLGDGLTATGQITGNGGENFEPTIAWAYVSYAANENWTLQAGRQRLPLFYYSDFLDVAYAYHWIRTPQQIAASFNDTFEGIKFNYRQSTDNWDWDVSAYGGSGDKDIILFTTKMENLLGLVVKTSNDWLQLRASVAKMDMTSDDLPVAYTSNGVTQATDDNPVEYSFLGLAAYMTFNSAFVMAEYTYAEADEPIGPDLGIGGYSNDLGWYISTGMRFGAFTPHITYGNNTLEYEQINNAFAVFNTEFEESVNYWTIGARWDFHPSAVAKIDYTSQMDDSDDFFKNSAGLIGVGYGDRNEVDAFSIGIDVIF